MALSFLPAVLENLNSLIQTEVGLLWGVDKEMKKLSGMLSAIVAVLEDAEEKQFKSKAIQDWLRKLKGVAYEVDDILDDFATEALRWKTKGQTSSSLKKVSTSVSYPFANIMFRHTIGNRMKEITEKLSAIAEERNKFHLREAVVGKRCEFADGRETGYIAQPEVYGREEEKQKIVKVLVEDTCQRDEVSVYPIIGIGGLGKTTLAQMVFNDEKVNCHFEPKIWVYVSQDFDVKRVIKATLESATGKASDAVDRASLERGLRNILNEKRYLIVLDDMWDDDIQEKWDSLKGVLECGSKGAAIINTTRLEKVSSIMGTIPPLHLSFLSNEFCLLLFRKCAFGHGNQERQNLVDIGKEIVKKCGGVPLAAKALGGLLHSKYEESEWNLVKESEVWNLPLGEDSILPALRLSYYDLSPELRRCFAYCAVFPKGCAIDKENLILLWMANGYISCKGTLELEDIGGHTWNELCRRSFFQVEEKYSFTCLFKMHDLMHDLAQSVMEYKCHIMENESSSCIPKHIIHHVTLLGHTKNTIVFPKSLQTVQSLRSILLKVKDFPCGNDDATDRFSCDFSKFHSLRAIDAGGSKKFELSSSIGNLKHLRFLNLSWTQIQTLPKSICSLHNLQTLNLNNCRQLRMLPKNLKNLRNLRHLYLNGCVQVHDMPPKLGQLTLLKTLSFFCTSNGGNRSLAELQHLDLGGELHIKHLERVRNSADAKEANLVGKQTLRILKLEWSPDIPDWESQANVEQLLEDLRPHHNVEELVIENYKGVQFPLWMGDSTLKNVVSIVLLNCSNCLLLPPFGRLPSLRCLKISRMDCVEYFENDFPGGGPVSEFPFLEELCIWDLPNLKAFSREERRYQFHRLRTIFIRNCPKLTLPRLSSSETLKMNIERCSDVMLSSISNLNCPTSLWVSGNDDAISLPEQMLQNLTSLESLIIEGFSKLKVLPANLSSLVSLKSLRIWGCYRLESLPEHGLRSLKSVRRLDISGCNDFISLPESLGHLTALEELDLIFNPRLVAIPESIKHLGSLRTLHLGGSCGTYTSELKALPEALRHVTPLQSLIIRDYPELTSLPEWMGNFSSLQSLDIWSCPKIQSLPQSIQSLTKLKSLMISRCGPELERRCQKESGEDWSKIAHIQECFISTGYKPYD